MSEKNVLLLVIIVVALASFQNLLLLIVAKLGSKDIRLLLQSMIRLMGKMFEKSIVLLGETIVQIIALGNKLPPATISSLLISLFETMRRKFS